MKTIHIITVLVITLFSVHTQASSTPWIGTLAANGSISVPAGKVLIIEQIGYNFVASSNTQLTISGSSAGGIGSGSFSVTIQLGVISQTVLTLPKPIRLGPGMTISNPGGGFSYAIFGIAEDATDFIASTVPITKGLMADAGYFSTVIDSNTAAPTTVSGEASTDLKVWSSEGVSVSRSSSNPRLSKLTTPMDAPKKFVRAKVTAHTATPN